MSLISVEHLHFAYGKEQILRDVDLRIDSGDFVCILGESGCGKSTFLRLMAGLAEPTSGAIRINGTPVRGAGLDRGVVFQDYSLFPWFSAGRNIVLSLRQKFTNKSKKELKEIVLRGLRDVGLDESVYRKYPFELSGGMRQRCAICRAFALDPPVLLMDEPFGALDAITRGRLQRMILRLWRQDEQRRKTILFVTHDVDEALLLANKIFVFGSSPGRLIHSCELPEGTKPPVEELFDDPEIIRLRTRLLQVLNNDVTMQISTEGEYPT